jgi:alkylhydroperoxidase family enzyme
VSTPRIQPLPPSEWGDDESRAIAAGFGDGAVETFRNGDRPCPNVLTTLVRNPTIAGPWLRWNNVLFQQLDLDTQLRELAILRVAVRTGAEYEWAQHARMAQQIGIADEEIDAVGVGTAGTHTWSDVEAAVLDATDELVADHVISDATWARLSEQLDDRVITELIFVVGSYTALAMAFNSFGMQLDADLVGTGRPFPRSEPR